MNYKLLFRMLFTISNIKYFIYSDNIQLYWKVLIDNSNVPK